MWFLGNKMFFFEVLFLFYVYECFFHTCVCASCAYSVSLEVRRRSWIPWNWSFRWLWAAFGCWELNLCPLEEKHILLTTEHLSSPTECCVLCDFPLDCQIMRKTDVSLTPGSCEESGAFSFVSWQLRLLVRELTAFVRVFTGEWASMFSDTKQSFTGSLH